MSQQQGPRIVLHGPVVVADRTVEHAGQPGQYLNGRGAWEQAGEPASWRRAGDAELRVYDLVEPTTG